jgi:hypothetical protein
LPLKEKIACGTGGLSDFFPAKGHL